jgi:NTE family protein
MHNCICYFSGVDNQKESAENIKNTKQEHRAEIKDIIYVTRDEPYPHMYENADFSPETIKTSIKEGETKTLQALKRHQV